MLSHLRRHAVAYLALFLALGGTSFAATRLDRNSVGTKQLRTGAVRSSDLAKNAVTGSKVKNGSLSSSDFKKGTVLKGAKGDKGPKGDKGDTGPATGPAGGDLAGSYPNPTLKPLGDWTTLGLGSCRIVTTPASWTSPVNGSSPLSVRVDRTGMAHLRGQVACSQVSNVSVVAALPDAAKPKAVVSVAVPGQNGATQFVATAKIDTDGFIQVSRPGAAANDSFSLDSVEWDTLH